jgi:hypothetical protein
MVSKAQRLKSVVAATTLLLVGCAPNMAWQVNNMSQGELRELSDDQICFWYVKLHMWPPSPTFTNELNRRGVICGARWGDGVLVGYTQYRLDTDDDATCRSYGAKPKTKTYIDCRLQLKAQRENNYQAQQALQVQRDAVNTAASQNLMNTGLQMMQQSQPDNQAVQPVEFPTMTTCRNYAGNQVRCVNQ